MDSAPVLPSISMNDFDYPLPDEKIARYPLAQRDDSKLLVFKKGEMTEGRYTEIARFLPKNSLLVFNNSRVLEARILMNKPNGGQIEIFCLEPHESFRTIAEGMSQKGKVLWACLIGGASKWKTELILEKNMGDYILYTRLVEKRSDHFIVEFFWSPEHISFAEILSHIGSIPLPPYLKREAEISDAERYQTVYARERGSVAAPTAGLHFTNSLLSRLADQGIDQVYLTLHVGAGTFMPVKSENISEHQMHEEFIEINSELIRHLIEKNDKTVVAVGTTSLRTLESLYWLGLMISGNKNISASELVLEQWFPYRNHENPDALSVLKILLEWIEQQPEKKLITKTKLLIVPGYHFKIVQGLITNFHQPHSTLLLLVAAFIGKAWKNVYTFALENDYRFLSYGDGCLFMS
jgi:S-adenosylmethionine:tRNA ribosyltransferase-isomerase